MSLCAALRSDGMTAADGNIGPRYFNPTTFFTRLASISLCPGAPSVPRAPCQGRYVHEQLASRPRAPLPVAQREPSDIIVSHNAVMIPHLSSSHRDCAGHRKL